MSHEDDYVAFKRSELIRSRATATMSIAPSQGVRAGWTLFWLSVWAMIRRRRSVDISVVGR